MSVVRLRPAWFVGAITTASFLLYAAVSLLRWWHFDLDSYDLPLYHQIVWQLSRLHAPAVSVLGEANYFGDHFSPILVLFAPLYWVAQTPFVLLVGQAALIAASIPAVYLYARRRVPAWMAVVLCVAYAQSWGVWAAVDSAVHEVAFAAPLVAWGIYFADCKRWTPVWLCLGALVFVKEDLGLVVAAVGVVLALRGERRHGPAFVVAGMAAFAVVNLVVMPAINPDGWSARDAAIYGQYGTSAGDAALHLATHPGDLAAAVTDDQQKLRLLALLIGAFAGLSLLSPLTLLAVPQVLERLVADDPHLWGPSYQYSVVLMVILALAAADGTAVLTRVTAGRRAVSSTLVVCAGVIALVSAATFPLNRLVRPGYWRQGAMERAANAAAQDVPRDASLAADWASLAHVPPRGGMFLVNQVRTQRPDYVLLHGRGAAPAPASYELLDAFAGERVYRRRAADSS